VEISLISILKFLWISFFRSLVGDEQWHFLQESWKKLTGNPDLHGELTTREAVLFLGEGLECSNYDELCKKMAVARGIPETGLQRTFSKVLDVDKSNSISWTEFVTAWALLSRGLPEEKAKGSLRKVSSASSYCRIPIHPSIHPSTHPSLFLSHHPFFLFQLSACFMALDENDDGELSREEISKFWDIFQHVIEKKEGTTHGATPAQSKALLHKLIDKLFLQADKDGSGTISLEEYLSFVSRSQDSWVLGYCLGLA
jgi:Ca2+-binding EF-hand superfamily protein